MESINTNLILPTKNKTDFTKSVRQGKRNKDLNLSKRIEISETIASPNAKMRDLQEKENRNKNSRRQTFIIDDSMGKHINGPGISKNDQVQIKTHPGATTDDIIDILSQLSVRSQISLLSILEQMT